MNKIQYDSSLAPSDEVVHLSRNSDLDKIISEIMQSKIDPKGLQLKPSLICFPDIDNDEIIDLRFLKNYKMFIDNYESIENKINLIINDWGKINSGSSRGAQQLLYFSKHIIKAMNRCDLSYQQIISITNEIIAAYSTYCIPNLSNLMMDIYYKNCIKYTIEDVLLEIVQDYKDKIVKKILKEDLKRDEVNTLHHARLVLGNELGLDQYQIKIDDLSTNDLLYEGELGYIRDKYLEIYSDVNKLSEEVCNTINEVKPYVIGEAKKLLEKSINNKSINILLDCKNVDVDDFLYNYCFTENFQLTPLATKIMLIAVGILKTKNPIPTMDPLKKACDVTFSFN